MNHIRILSLHAFVVFLVACDFPAFDFAQRDVYPGTYILSEQLAATKTVPDDGDRWLFISYLAGDNNLSEYLWSDLNEIEYGLFLLAGDVSVDVYAFWDGCTSETSSGFAPANTKIYKLAGDNRLHATYSTYYRKKTPYLLLSNDTQDLTDQASFITNDEAQSDNADTLKNFLLFVKEQTAGTSYDKVVLTLSDHGSGPGEYITFDSRSMFQDVTTNTDNTAFMTSKDCASALTEAGYTGDNKFDLIFFDLCLAGSVEDAYCFRNNAQYMMASPEIMYADGIDYVPIFQNLVAGITVNDFSQKIIEKYKEMNAWTDATWQSQLATYRRELLENKTLIEQSLATLNSYTILQRNQTAFYDAKVSDYTAQLDIYTDRIAAVEKWTIKDYQQYVANVTLSLYDLSKVENLSTAIQSFATKISECDNDVQHDLKLLLWGHDAITYLPNTPYYSGTYAYLYDLGSYVTNVATFATANNLTELNVTAQNVITALKSVVVSAWRDGFVYKDESGNRITDCVSQCAYGITICGEDGVKRNKYTDDIIFVTAFPPSYIESQIPFVDAVPSWANLISLWFSSSDIYQ